MGYNLGYDYYKTDEYELPTLLNVTDSKIQYFIIAKGLQFKLSQ